MEQRWTLCANHMRLSASVRSAVMLDWGYSLVLKVGLWIDTFMSKTARLYQDTRTANAASSNLDRLNDDLQDVTRIMTKNMEELLWRGDSLDSTYLCYYPRFIGSSLFPLSSPRLILPTCTNHIWHLARPTQKCRTCRLHYALNLRSTARLHGTSISRRCSVNMLPLAPLACFSSSSFGGDSYRDWVRCVTYWYDDLVEGADSYIIERYGYGNMHVQACYFVLNPVSPFCLYSFSLLFTYSPSTLYIRPMLIF